MSELMITITPAIIIIGLPAAWTFTVIMWKRHGYRLRLYELPIIGKYFLPKSRSLSAATASRDLVPLIAPYIRTGSRLIVVSADLSYFDSKNGGFWKHALKRWSGMGCEIVYIPIDCSDHRTQIENAAACGVNVIEVCSNNADVEDPEKIDLMKKFSVFHPVMLLNPDNSKIMWIEHYHPKGSAMAHDVEFVSDASDSNGNRFGRLTRELNILVGSDIWSESAALCEEMVA